MKEIIYTVKVNEIGTFWHLDGKLNREAGPAIEHTNGDRFWCKDDRLHRIDGPAIEWSNGNKYWYLNGKSFTEDDFNAQCSIQSKVEMTLDEIENLLGKRIKIVTNKSEYDYSIKQIQAIPSMVDITRSSGRTKAFTFRSSVL
jgi:hypothetical protein